VYGCCKLYDTYVGSKNFQPDNDHYLEQLGKEFETTRKRQCNWLNLYNLKKSIIVNGCTHIIFNKCDIFQEININKLLNSSDESL
jgi:adenylosuccinate synthase